MVAVILALFVLLSLSCGPAADPDEPDPDENDVDVDPDPIEEPEEEETVTVGQVWGPLSWDPPQDWGSNAEMIIQNTYDYLFYRSPDNAEWVPELAYEWERIDELTMRFYLEEGVKFHDGTELTAHDVKHHYRRIVDDDRTLYMVANQYQFIDEMIVHDDYTIDFVTDEPFSLFMWRLSQQNTGAGIVSGAYFDEVGYEGVHAAPMGSGPWILKDYARDEFVHYERNDDYWQTDKIPNFDYLIFRNIPEASTRTAELLTGGIDITFDIHPEDESRLINEPNVNELWGRQSRAYFFHMRLERNPEHQGDPQLDREFLTEDWRIRKAIELSLDKYALRDIFGGDGEAMRLRNLPPAEWAHPDLYGEKANLYDPERAGELIQEAGYELGEAPLVMHAGQFPQCEDIARVAASMLEDAGFDVDLHVLARPIYDSEILEPGKWEELLLRPLGGNHNPAFATGGLLSGRHDARSGPGMVNEETLPDELHGYHERVDELLDIAYTEVLDEDKRNAAFHEAIYMAAEARAGLLGLFQTATLWGMTDRVEYTPRFDSDIWGVDIKVVK